MEAEAADDNEFIGRCKAADAMPPQLHCTVYALPRPIAYLFLACVAAADAASDLCSLAAMQSWKPGGAARGGERA